MVLILKNLPANAGDIGEPWVRKIPWWRARIPTPVLLPGEAYGQRSLAGYSPQGHTESDTTEATEHRASAPASHGFLPDWASLA